MFEAVYTLHTYMYSKINAYFEWKEWQENEIFLALDRFGRNTNNNFLFFNRMSRAKMEDHIKFFHNSGEINTLDLMAFEPIWTRKNRRLDCVQSNLIINSSDLRL